MRKFALGLFLASFALRILAGLSSGTGDLLVVVAVPESRTVAIHLSMPADFASVPVTVISDQKNTALAYKETRQTIELITQKAKSGGRFRISTGVVSLSQHKGKSGYGLSSGSWSQPAATAGIYVLVPLAKEQDTIFSAGTDAAQFIEALSLPEKVRCELGTLQLAVENPEQYRGKLLSQIAGEARKTRELFAGTSTVKLDGLESSVLVRQADHRNVELFLNYSLSLTAEK